MKKYEIEEKLIAFCVDDGCEDCICEDGTPGYWLSLLSLSEMRISMEGDDSYDRRYVVKSATNKWDCCGKLPPDWEYATEDFTEAYNRFKEAMKRNGSFEKVHLTKDFESDYYCLYDDGSGDYRSSTNGDYGPGNPWDAPGMSVRDFLPGVIN